MSRLLTAAVQHGRSTHTAAGSELTVNTRDVILIQQGVAAFYLGPRRARMLSHFVRRGDLLGYPPEEDWAVGAETALHSLVLPRKDFESLLKDPEVAQEVIVAQARQLRRMHIALQRASLPSAKERIMAAIHEWADALGRDMGDCILVERVRRSKLAAMTALSDWYVKQVVWDLRDEGLIDIVTGGVDILVPKRPTARAA